MTHKKSVDSIRNEFEQLVEEKTSWGRNEIKILLEKAISNHYIKLADKEDNIEGTVLKKKTVTTVKKKRLRGRATR